MSPNNAHTDSDLRETLLHLEHTLQNDREAFKDFYEKERASLRELIESERSAREAVRVSLLRELDSRFEDQVTNYRKHLEAWQRLSIPGALLVGFLALGFWLGLLNWASSTQTTIQNQVKSKVDAIVDDKVLRDVALSRATSSLQDLIQQDLETSTLVGMVAACSRIKLYLEDRVDSATEYTSDDLHPMEIRELLYDLEPIMDHYAPELAAGRVSPNRRRALVFLLHGIVERATRGGTERALKWFAFAEDADPTFPEPQLLTAEFLRRKIKDIGNGNWENIDVRNEVAVRLNRLKTLDESAKNLEVQRELPYIYWADGKSALAAEEAEKEYNREDVKLGIRDPRLAYRIAWLHWQSGLDLPEEAAEAKRKLAVKWALRAYTLDHRYLKALNNYIWFSTHFLDRNDTIRPVISGSDPQLLQAIDVFARSPAVNSHSGMLETLARAQAAIRDWEAALATIEKSVKLAKLYETSQAAQKARQRSMTLIAAMRNRAIRE